MTNDTSNAQSSVPFDDDYNFDYGDEYMYPGYTFERPVYLYIWEMLVIITFIQNVLILSVFMRRKMRNSTNIIFCAMAISDSLSGLVTLPAYIMVFQKYDPLPVYDYEDSFVNQSQGIYHEQNGIIFKDNMYPDNSAFMQSTTDIKESSNYSNETQNAFHLQTTTTSRSMFNATETLPSTIYISATLAPVDGYTLSKSLCRGFMISKYFLSKSFHTISIFLTLFLEIQRYVSMAYPYRYETCFNKLRIVKIYCISVFILCPFLHAFHLVSEKAKGGMCQWELTGIGCGKECIYLWIAFIVRHFIPCVTLVTFTLLFIIQLRKGEQSFRRMDSNASQYSRRVHENRRITFVVAAVVIVRLIPEIPYSIFLLYNSIDVSVYMGKDIDLETNRIYHMCYEICLIFSFLSNFYIYLIVNKSFRKRLYGTYIEPVRKQLYVLFRIHEFQPSQPLQKVTTKLKSPVKPEEEIEMNTIHSNISDKPVRL